MFNKFLQIFSCYIQDLSEQLLHLDISANLAALTIWDASTIFPAASFITGAAPRFCYVNCALPELLLEFLLC